MHMMKEIIEIEYKIAIKNDILTQCNNKWDQQQCNYHHHHHLRTAITLICLLQQSEPSITAAKHCTLHLFCHTTTLPREHG